MDCTSAFRQWWDDLTREGDPMRIPNPCAKGFTAGWYACEKEHERLREETRKLLLKACNERDSLLESIRYICDSARIAAASELKTRKLLEEAHDDLDKMRGKNEIR